MNQYEKEEFSDFLKRNKNISIFATCAFLLAGVLLAVVFRCTIHEAYLYAGLNGLEYRYAFVGVETPDVNTYAKFPKLCTLSADSKQMNVNVYFKLSDVEYRPNVPMSSGVGMLNESEIAVSKKVAERLNLSIGNILEIEFPLSEKPSKYTVKSIFEYADDYYEISQNRDFSCVLLNYDADLTSNMRTENVAFFNESEKEAFLESNNSYKRLYNISADVSNVKTKKILRDSFLGLVYLLICFTFFAYDKRKFSKELMLYYRDGYSLSTIGKFRLLFRRVVVLIPTALSWIYVLLFWDYYLLWISCSFVMFMILWFGKGDYEKTY